MSFERDYLYLAAQALGLVRENSLKDLVHPSLHRVFWGGFVFIWMLFLQDFTDFVQKEVEKLVRVLFWI